MSSLIHCITFVAAACVLNVYADQWVPAQSFEKEFYNNLIQVRVRTPLKGGAPASAEIVKREKSGPVKLCSGDLSNEKRPVQVFASRNGKALVTVDEWEHAGYQHALVFYQCAIRLVLKKEYSLEDFLSPAEIMEYAPMSISSRNWSRNAEFKMEKEMFTVKLKSGRTIHFSLKDGTKEHK